MCCLHLRVPDLGVTPHKTYHLGYTPRWAGGKTPTASAPGRGAHRRSTGELDGIVQVHQCRAPPGHDVRFWLMGLRCRRRRRFSSVHHRRHEAKNSCTNLDDLSTHGSTTTSSSIISTTCRPMAPLRRPKRSPFSTQLRPALQ
jgi:hypothetical protein